MSPGSTLQQGNDVGALVGGVHLLQELHGRTDSRLSAHGDLLDAVAVEQLCADDVAINLNVNSGEEFRHGSPQGQLNDRRTFLEQESTPSKPRPTRTPNAADHFIKFTCDKLRRGGLALRQPRVFHRFTSAPACSASSDRAAAFIDSMTSHPIQHRSREPNLAVSLPGSKSPNPPRAGQVPLCAAVSA